MTLSASILETPPSLDTVEETQALPTNVQEVAMKVRTLLPYLQGLSQTGNLGATQALCMCAGRVQIQGVLLTVDQGHRLWPARTPITLRDSPCPNFVAKDSESGDDSGGLGPIRPRPARDLQRRLPLARHRMDRHTV